MTDATMKDAEGADKKAKKGEKKVEKEPVKELSEKQIIAATEVPVLLKKCAPPPPHRAPGLLAIYSPKPQPTALIHSVHAAQLPTLESTLAPGDSPRHEGTPFRGLHVRRERLGFVHRSRTLVCRAVPKP
jgi:hypothetical protein